MFRAKWRDQQQISGQWRSEKNSFNCASVSNLGQTSKVTELVINTGGIVVANYAGQKRKRQEGLPSITVVPDLHKKRGKCISCR